MNPTTNDKLCPQCSRVNLHPLTVGRSQYTTRVNEFDVFWDLPQVLNSPNCPLCRLLIHCFRADEGFNVNDVGKFDRICGVYAGLELQLSVFRREGITRSSYSLQSCVIENDHVRGRLEKTKTGCFDVGELRSWLDRCGEGHRECKVDLWGRPVPPGFRLIDVERGCIVKAESCPVYCALSYVWGSVDQLVLKKSNLAELERENTLFSEKFCIPNSILDAIKLCQAIGQKYLWVDCLCILQDEQEDKHSQIGSMDAVYSLAFLTIVAAAGDDANAGLSPFTSSQQIPGRSIHAETISGDNIISFFSPRLAAVAVMKSKWASRGWTLQEYALSKRSVIFTGQYVFFRCEEALWAEDLGLKISGSWGNGPSWDLPLHRYSTASQDISRHYSQVYSQLAAQYIRRVLTNEEDILDAFLGILSRLEVSIGPHFWGMPSKEFGVALRWLPNLSFPISRRPLFPSWSWTGWMHTTTVLNSKSGYDDMFAELDSWQRSSSLLSCFNITDDAKINCFEKNTILRLLEIHLRAVRDVKWQGHPPVIGKAIEEHFTPPSNYEQILKSYVSAPTASDPPLSHYVFFWTSCSTLLVGRNRKSTRSCGVQVDEFVIYERFGEFNYSIGNVYMDVAVRERQPEMMEFAVTTGGILSDATIDSHGIRVELGLILIERCHDTTLETYTRVPSVFASIEQSFWGRTKPRQCLIALT